jgi:hypothetical protein
MLQDIGQCAKLDKLGFWIAPLHHNFHQHRRGMSVMEEGEEALGSSARITGLVAAEAGPELS